jgi:hypothetical protein
MTPEAVAGDSHQTWAWDRAAGRWRFDVFREPHDADVWICRRDEQRIRRPYREIIRWTDDGIPYLAVEVVLLFKAKHRRDKDEADFNGVLPLRCRSFLRRRRGQAWRGTAAARAGSIKLGRPRHRWGSDLPRSRVLAAPGSCSRRRPGQAADSARVQCQLGGMRATRWPAYGAGVGDVVIWLTGSIAGRREEGW